jgi:hypothetical protein
MAIHTHANGSAAKNMAIDEAIFLENQRQSTGPTLRLYGWQNPNDFPRNVPGYRDGNYLNACRLTG